MECAINSPALWLLMKHLVIGQCLKTPNFSAFHWSPCDSLVSIGQHFLATRVVHLLKCTETSLITESTKEDLITSCCSYARAAQFGPIRTRLCGPCIAVIAGYITLFCSIRFSWFSENDTLAHFHFGVHDISWLQTVKKILCYFVTFFFIFVKPACDEQDIVVTTSVQCVCVCVVRSFCSVHCASFWICPGHNSFIHAWI